MQISACAVRRF